ncbi:thioredoxin family protein [Coraliomargarita parva]|uniref:thioredoxin family protein n=1 Tax=Coraliomargarita parva TaxID=3014050 RepID=UPI0022B2BA1A|nr:thioredoxin domain-containing protein [Coraliomargarita parva]
MTRKLHLTACLAVLLILHALCPLVAETGEAKLRLLYFTADWCGPCQLMQQQTWPVPAVQSELRQYTLTKIDIDAEKETARKWSVSSIPTFIISDSEGTQALVRTSGFKDGDQMVQWLQDARVMAMDQLARQRATQAKYEASQQMLRKATGNWDQPENAAAVQALFTLLAMRESLTEAQSTSLDRQVQALAEQAPGLLAQGILHRDLQVRVRVARALSTEDTPLDAWASESERTRQCEAYRSAIQRGVLKQD